jgi:hypothetical protein
MRKPIIYERSVTAERPMPVEEFFQAERILARIVAEAFAADHPELFAAKCSDVAIITSSRLEVGPIRKDKGKATR